MGSLLATVDQMAAFMQLTLTSSDPTATLYLEIASDMVRDKLKQQLDAVAADVVMLDPINGGFVVLPELPVATVTLLEILDTTQSPAVWTTVDPSLYTVSQRLGIIAGLPGCGVFWPSIPQSWRVTYSHGYGVGVNPLPGFPVLPNSLVGVVLGVAARAYSSPASIESERIGGYQVKYAVEADGFSSLEMATLNSYRDANIS